MVAHSARIDNPILSQSVNIRIFSSKTGDFSRNSHGAVLIRIPPLTTQKPLQFPHASVNSRPWRGTTRFNTDRRRRSRSREIMSQPGSASLPLVLPIQIAASTITQKENNRPAPTVVLTQYPTTHTFSASQVQPQPRPQEPQLQTQVILP